MSAQAGAKSPAVKRKDNRVQFSRGISVQMLAIDGTWAMPCTMLDVAEGGAKLRVSGAVERRKLRKFFLVLSVTGNAYRHCELAWLNGDQIGVYFLAKDEMTRRPPHL